MAFKIIKKKNCCCILSNSKDLEKREIEFLLRTRREGEFPKTGKVNEPIFWKNLIVYQMQYL